MLGAPREDRAAGSVLTFAAALFLFASLDHVQAASSTSASFSISPDWRLGFTTGVDGLSAIMVLLAGIVTLALCGSPARSRDMKTRFMPVFFSFSGGAIGAFASNRFIFLLRVSRTRADPHIFLIGIWGSGIGSQRPEIQSIWHRQFYSAARLILLYQSFPLASRSFDIRCCRLQPEWADLSGRATACLSAAAYRFREFSSHSFRFTRGRRKRMPPHGTRCDAARWGVEEIRTLWAIRLAIPMLAEGARHWATLLVVLLLGQPSSTSDWLLSRRGARLDARVLEREHMGYIFLGIASLVFLVWTGAVVLMFASGLSIALLFGIAGELRGERPRSLFDELGGLARVMPFAGLAFGLGVFAAIGSPASRILREKS